MKVDLIFKNAFKGIEANKKDRIMISAQDDLQDIGFRQFNNSIVTREGERVDIVNYSQHANVLPVLDPLDYLDRKKEDAKNIEIDTSNSEVEEGFKKGELIPLGFDREEDEDERIREDELKKKLEFPDLNIGIPEEVKLKEEAKQAKIRELQADPANK